MMTCPKCKKQMHLVCGNPKCVCATRIPENEKPMLSRDIGGFTIETCPYCGFEQCGEWWAERELLETDTWLKDNHELLPQNSKDLNALVDLINQEIEWCETHRGTSNKSSDFEEGFIGGLNQATYLIGVAIDLLEGSEE